MNEGMDFDQLFAEIAPEEIRDNVFTLVGKVLPVVTSGREDNYNSMTASGGGMGLVFMKPATLCIFPENRYTLEIIKKERKYTLSYFPEEYHAQVLFLGSKSGRDSNKMKEVDLTGVKTPSGAISFIEARLIIECKLTQATTVPPDDFYEQEARDCVAKAYEEAKVYRQYVFGEITHVWIKRVL